MVCEKIPVVFCFNNAWAAVPGCVCLASLLENAGAETFYEFTIVHSDISQENSRLLQSQVEQYPGHSLAMLKVPRLESGNKFTANYAPDVYNRLFLSDFFPEYKKVVYLDVDLVVEMDLSALYSHPLGEEYLAAVKDTVVDELIREKEHPFFSEEYIGNYFNSGVLLMNLEKIREDKLEESFADQLDIEYRLLDQDILNKVCFGKVSYLPEFYNFFARELGETREEELRRKCGIIHYVGPRKPWRLKKDSPVCRRWWKYAAKSIVKVKKDYKFLLKYYFNKVFRCEITGQKTKIKLLGFTLFSKKRRRGILRVKILGIPFRKKQG